MHPYIVIVTRLQLAGLLLSIIDPRPAKSAYSQVWFCQIEAPAFTPGSLTARLAVGFSPLSYAPRRLREAA
ncbi:MAG: hypothetical protein ACRDGS_09345 [Chloroflexota bacterium]